MREGWQVKKVSDVASVRSGATPSTKEPANWDGNIPWLTPKDLSERPSKYTERGTRSITQQGLKKTAMLPAGSVLLTSRAPVGYVSIARNPISTNQGFKSLVLDDGQLPEFWYFLLQNSTKYLLDNSGGSTFKEISKKSVENLKFHLPPLHEQRRIVDLMDSVDAAIIAAQAEVQATEALRKQVLASELGSPRSEWGETTLGELEAQNQGSIQTGPFGSQLHKSDYSEEGVPVVMPTNIRRLKIDPGGIARVSNSHVSRLQRHALREGDIVYSRRGDVEKCALIGPSEQGWLCGTGCLLVRVGGETLSPEWLSHYLSTAAIRRWISNHAVGATMPNLNTKILRGVPVSLPSRAEQDHLVQTMAALDSAADTCLTTLDGLRDLRSSMLSVLLSGDHEIPETYDQFLGQSEVVQAG